MFDVTKPAAPQIDAYIASLDGPFSASLAHLRKVILDAAPEAQEIITYSMPGIGLNGPVVAYFAFKNHLSFFPMGHSVFEGMAAKIAPWRTGKGTLQFTPENAIPDAIIAAAVRARCRENVARIESRRLKSRNRRA